MVNIKTLIILRDRKGQKIAAGFSPKPIVNNKRFAINNPFVFCNSLVKTVPLVPCFEVHVPSPFLR